jgi:uncharacterized membrane protein YdbT with pleckstrin-like domain
VGYIETVLGSDEHIMHRGRLHWIIYFPAFLMLAIGLAAIAYAVAEGGQVAGGLGVILLGVAALDGVRAWIVRITTEIAVTNRRVMVKRGLIRRSTIEMNLGQVETVGVEQSIAGRLLDFGTVIVRGTGAGIEPIGKIAAPLQMREAVGVMRVHGQ